MTEKRPTLCIVAGPNGSGKTYVMKRRAFCHDYRHRGIYMLTLVCEGRRRLFGRLCVGNEPYVELSPLGRTIKEEEARKIHAVYPNIKVWRVCVMPDHLHIILRVAAWEQEGKHLGHVMAGFKYGCTQAYRRLTGEKGNLFEKGYNDRILLEEGQLEHWKKYLDENPRRLAMKQARPDLFTVLSERNVAGCSCQIIGNRFLLDIPDKMAVVVHRADSDEDYQRKRAEWLACGERGGVLVSAAIAQREKAVLREAMELGHAIILLCENGFPPLHKPSGESFYACARGQLLKISPWPYHSQKRAITREQCLALNRLAEDIAHKACGGTAGHNDENRSQRNCEPQ